MGRLDAEARMAIKALSARGSTPSEIARLLGVTEGAVRYHARRMAVGAVDGRAQQWPKAEAFAAAIEHWRGQQDGGGVNLAALHDWLRREHGYDGSLRSVQRYWRRTTRRRPSGRGGGSRRRPGRRRRWTGRISRGDRRRRGGRPGGAAHGAVVEPAGGDRLGESKDMLAWLGCHTPASPARRRPGDAGVDNEKTAITRGAGAWGTTRPVGRDGLVAFERAGSTACRSASSARRSRSAASPARCRSSTRCRPDARRLPPARRAPTGSAARGRSEAGMVPRPRYEGRPDGQAMVAMLRRKQGATDRADRRSHRLAAAHRARRFRRGAEEELGLAVTYKKVTAYGPTVSKAGPGEGRTGRRPPRAAALAL